MLNRAALARAWRHLTAAPVGRRCPAPVMARIADAIAASETRHHGEICFAVAPALGLAALWRGKDARDAALAAFRRLGVDRTAGRNGVLIYLLLADRRIEIVADRGLDGHIHGSQWDAVCARMAERLRAEDVEGAALRGVAAVDALLAAHAPRAPDAPDRNELPDAVRTLD